MSLRLAVPDGEAAPAVLRFGGLPDAVWRRYLVFDGGREARLCTDGEAVKHGLVHG